MSPFPEKKRDPLEANTTLQQALDAAIAASPHPPMEVPIAIVAIGASGQKHAFAEHRGAEIHYSASLLKVAALYAAFELRAAATRLVFERHLKPAEVFPTLKSEFNDAIRNNRVPQLSGLQDEKLLMPKYEQMFTVDPVTAVPNFAPGYWKNLEGAISDGKNEGAAECVHGLGFGYLTKAMAEAGFLRPDLTADPKTADGIWLAGDYGFGYTPQKIPSVNDDLVAQATSVRQMARLFTLLQKRELIDPVSDGAMVDLLERAVKRGHIWLNRDTTVAYKPISSKIGVGSLKIGPTVISEALVVQQTTPSRLFVVVYQNVRLEQNPASIFPIARIVDKTIASFPG